MNLPLYRVMLVKESVGRRYRYRITSDEAAYRALRPFFRNLDREQFIVCCLDAKHEVRAVNIVSVGSLTQAVIHPREVFKPAILANAHAVILAHNHPSGDPTPSDEDRAITERLQLAGDLLGIKVLDSLVFGDSSYRRVVKKRRSK